MASSTKFPSKIHEVGGRICVCLQLFCLKQPDRIASYLCSLQLTLWVGVRLLAANSSLGILFKRESAYLIMHVLCGWEVKRMDLSKFTTFLSPEFCAPYTMLVSLEFCACQCTMSTLLLDLKNVTNFLAKSQKCTPHT